MKNISVPILFLYLLLINTLESQISYKNFQSSVLDDERKLKVQLPRGYDDDEEKKKTYPLILVLDGDYMFESVAGNVDLFSYWDDMPKSIVVGINQIETRDEDCLFSKDNSLPFESGEDFFVFISTELIPHLKEEYRISDFKIIIGHGKTANFINYFLLKDTPIFQGYIAISPELAPNMMEYIPNALGKKFPLKTYYYLSNTSSDISLIRRKSSELNNAISSMASMNSESLGFKFNRFNEISFYLSPTYAIPDALNYIFKPYQPISLNEYENDILTSLYPPVTYLKKKYESILKTYGIEKEILLNDFKAISAAIEKNQSFNDYEELSKMAKKSFSKTILPFYFLGRFYEETGKPKKAMHVYKSSYRAENLENFNITKDTLFDRAEKIKADFGY